MNRADIVAEMRDAAADFRTLLDGATSRELRSGTDGTKWTNEQLLFHMLFGYLVVRRLLQWPGLSRPLTSLGTNRRSKCTKPLH